MEWNKSQVELSKLYNANTHMVYAYKTVYQVFYSVAQKRYYTQIIRKSNTAYTLKGRIHATSDHI